MQNDSCPTCRRPLIPAGEPSERDSDVAENSPSEAHLAEALRDFMLSGFQAQEMQAAQHQSQYNDSRDDFVGLYS